LNQRVALALRSTLYSPEEILTFAKLADETQQVSTIFFPDIWAALDSIELSAAALAATKRVKVGSGVLRPLEHDLNTLVRRVGTVQYLSKNRFVLGVGTGKPVSNPRDTITRMLTVVDEVKNAVPMAFKGRGVFPPEVFVAALRLGIAKRAIRHSDGLILNFCSPEYAGNLVRNLRSGVGSSVVDSRTLVCYIKIFYSKDEKKAKRLLIEEFANYDANPQYHDMFVQDAVADDIRSASRSLSSKGSPEISESLHKISLANPSVEQLQQLVNKFRTAGINLPCVYPYFALDEEPSHKFNIIKQIMKIN
jgi:alkanesulfonate monooxygenase SsuD/methylene tetrahydromethanopterin reductase-like flavin-dependent oxidoreductase (luciferase family)